MKKSLHKILNFRIASAIACAAIIAGCANFATSNEQRITIDESSTIVIASKAPEVVQFAAKELQTYLKKINGVDVCVVTDNEKVPGKMILVGKSKYTDNLALRKTFDPDSFMIKVVGDTLVLMGDDKDKLPGRGKWIAFKTAQSRKGTIFAVYSLLEKQFGVRWLWPGNDGEVIPKLSKLSIPSNLDIYEKPDFLWRHFFFYSGKELPLEIKYKEIPLWSMRNKLGVTIGSPWSFAHSWARYLTNKHFKEHPEYYSLIDGKRQPFRVNKKGRPYARQICTSNPDVLKIFVEKIRKAYDTSSDAIVSVSPNDGLDFCECADCKALDHPELYGPEEGYKGQVLSDRIYSFVNQIAREVRKTHPKLKVGIFSYTVVRPVPRALKKLEDNVVISMTQTDAQYRNSDYKKKNRKRLAEWIGKGGAYIGRDYVDNYSFAAVTHPQTRILAEDLRYMKNNKFIGFYTEASISFATNFLNYYVLSKLMWRPDTNLDSIINDFCDKAYGKAGGVMRNYFDLMEDSFMACETPGIHPGNIPDWYSHATIAKAYALLDEAAKIADTKSKARIKYTRIGLEYTDKVVSLFRIYRRLNDCGLPIGIVGYTPDTSKKYSRDQIVEFLKSAIKLQTEVMAMLDKYKTTSLIQPYSFCRQNEVKRWFKTVDGYWNLYGGSGKIQKMTILQDVWKFKIDPQNTGIKEKWFATDFDTSGWKDMRIDAHWEKQGFANYDGYAWYRFDGVSVPKGKITGKYILRLGAVDESCWVYINGDLAGKSMYDAEKDPDGWKKPRSFDITRFLKPGADNKIAIRVFDSKYAGGIWQKAYLIHKKSDKGKKKNVFLENFDKKPLSGKYSTHLRAAKAAVDDNGALHIKVEKRFPDGFSMTIPKIKIDPDTQYIANISYRSKNVKENDNQKREWLKHPKLPQVRMIFSDKSGKTCVTVKEYVWFGGAFSTNALKSRDARRIFKTPKNAEFVRLTLYLNARGEYWIDSITIETL